MADSKRGFWEKLLKKRRAADPQAQDDYWLGDPGYVDLPPVDETPPGDVPPPPKKKKWWGK